MPKRILIVYIKNIWFQYFFFTNKHTHKYIYIYIYIYESKYGSKSDSMKKAEKHNPNR